MPIKRDRLCVCVLCTNKCMMLISDHMTVAYIVDAVVSFEFCMDCGFMSFRDSVFHYETRVSGTALVFNPHLTRSFTLKFSRFFFFLKKCEKEFFLC